MTPDAHKSLFGPTFGMGVYIHWPYCAKICPYCDFNVYAAKARDTSPLLGAIGRDLERHRDAYAIAGAVPEITSVFFGGGTPSLLSPDQIASMLDVIRSGFGLTRDCEVTLEANPLDCLRPDLDTWAQAGITRLSLGVQAFSDDALKFLGRDHTEEQAHTAVDLALASGLATSIDLIYALPGQTCESWRQALRHALGIGVGHVSLYELTISDATPFGRQLRRGTLTPLDETLQAELYEITQEETARAGMDAYEISNHAKCPTDRSRHNLTYWRSGDWIGVGPGAHGRLTLGSERFETHAQRRPEDYLEAVNDGRPGWDHHVALSRQEIAEEILIMGLRTLEGVARDRLQGLGLNLRAKTLEDLLDEGMIDAHALGDARIALSQQGRLLADAIASRLANQHGTD